jgi:hypothetical protein
MNLTLFLPGKAGVPIERIQLILEMTVIFN